MQLVDALGDREQLAERPEGSAPEVHVRAGQDHPDATVGQRVRDIYHAPVEELNLVDRDHLRLRSHPLGDLRR